MPEDRIDPLDHHMARIGSLARRLADFLQSNAATHLIGNANMPAETQAKLRAVLIPVAERISGQLGDLVYFLGRAVENADQLPEAIDAYALKVAPPVPPSAVKPSRKAAARPSVSR